MFSKKCAVICSTVAVVVCLAVVYMEKDLDIGSDDDTKSAALGRLSALHSSDPDNRSSSDVILATQSPDQCKNQLAQSTGMMTRGFETTFSTANSVIFGGLKEVVEPLSQGSAFCSLKGKLRRWVAGNQKLRISITGGSASQVTCQDSKDTYGRMLEKGLKRDFENQKNGCGAGPVTVVNVAQVCTLCMRTFVWMHGCHRE
jgi:hypothetical protein